ncbi:hypothetical protein E2I00_015965 [Balaenoptera physalus]|uniref:Uncharacterized protein n=1 Tax=Balaenoptera physalus TaxID=9770 RepID=A0A643BVD7_BALPH|nr:hypothetical protein E2I00_015965 [Balaenoptera physalus]
MSRDNCLHSTNGDTPVIQVQMMQNVHLAPETDEDDLYSGYNDYNPTYDTEELENDTAFQQAVKTSHGRRPPDGVTRPMTAVRAAGFTKAALRGKLNSMCEVSYPFSCAGLSTKCELLTVSQALRSTPSVSRGALHRPWRPGTKTGFTEEYDFIDKPIL